MATLLEIKEYLRNIYAKYDLYIVPVLKFLLAFVTLTVINGNLGYMEKLGNPAVVLIISLLCSFLPINIFVVIAGLYCVAHVYALALECALVVMVVFFIMYLLYFRFSPSDALVVIFTPICFLMKIPYVVPVAAGLIGTPVSAVSGACGVVAYYVLSYISTNSVMLGSLEADSAVRKFQYVVDNLMNNKEMVVMVVAFAATIILVYMIKRLPIDYSWSAALIIGMVVCVIITLVGVVTVGGSVSVLGVILGAIASFAIAAILQFFVFSVDYTRTENLQFEDDEYYYYVKAVPKLTVAVPEKKVKHINSAAAERNKGKRAEDYPVFNQSVAVPERPSRKSAEGAPRRAPQQQSRPSQYAEDRQRRMAGDGRGTGAKSSRPARARDDEYVRTDRVSSSSSKNNYIAANGRGPGNERRTYAPSRNQASSMAAPRRNQESLSQTESLRRVSSPTRSFKNLDE